MNENGLERTYWTVMQRYVNNITVYCKNLYTQKLITMLLNANTVKLFYIFAVCLHCVAPVNLQNCKTTSAVYGLAATRSWLHLWFFIN